MSTPSADVVANVLDVLWTGSWLIRPAAVSMWMSKVPLLVAVDLPAAADELCASDMTRHYILN